MVWRKSKKKETQKELVMSFFEKNSNRDIPHKEVVDWSRGRWKRKTGEVFRDPERAIRTLYEEGRLTKVAKGVYRYDPKMAQGKRQENFSKTQKDKILERDGNRCVVCGNGKKEGVELHVDHIRPRSRGGKATIGNGQTLCASHNSLKKDLGQTETGKKMFVKLYNVSKEKGNIKLQKFCLDVFEVYKKHNINGHISWEK